MTTETSRPPSTSSVETTHLVLPPDTNTHGNAFGGRIMQWMDIAASIAAGRHAGTSAVTAAVDGLIFRRPIREGDVVLIRASVNYAGRTSMEVGVRVDREEAGTRALEHCLTGYFTFVAVNADGESQAVPAVSPQTEAEKERFENARLRRERRLAARSSG